MKEMLSEITASFSRNRCLWAEFTMPATNPGCKEEAMIHFLALGLYTHHYSLKFYINTLRLLSSFKCKFTFVNVKRKFEFCWFFGSPCALDGHWGMEELTGQRTMYNIYILYYSHHPRQFHLWLLKQKKNRNNTRETTTNVFLTKGKRQKHISGTIFLTSIPPHSLNLLSSQVIPANYPADVFGKIKESNQSNRDESAFSGRCQDKAQFTRKIAFFLLVQKQHKKSSQQWCRVIPSNLRKGGHVFII